MTRFGLMTLTRRLKLGFGAVILILAIMIALNGSEMLWVSLTETWIGRAQDQVQVANEISTSAFLMDNELSALSEATARGYGITDAQQGFEAKATALTTALETALASEEAGSEGATALETVSALHSQYVEDAGEAFALAKTDPVNLPAKLTPLMDLGTKLQEAATSYQDHAMTRQAAKLDRLGFMAVSVVIITAVLGTIGFVGAILAAWWISRQIRRELNEAVSGIGSSVSELLAVASQVAAGAAQTSVATNEATVTVEEVKQTATVTLEKATGVAEDSRGAAEAAESGLVWVQKNEAGIERAQSGMRSIVEAVAQVSGHSRDIEEIMSAVNDLAEQSNLLSVNASIEAAKAGEYGRGFTVVAQEVKSLAEQSKQAVGRVRALLGEIQKSSAVAVRAAEQGRDNAEAGRERIMNSNEVIQRMAEGAVLAADSTAQIAASSHQQLAGMEQIGQAITSVNAATEQSVAGTKQVEQEVKHLEELALRLRRLVDARAMV